MNKSMFLETTKLIESKLNMNGHWMIPCKVGIFYVNLKSYVVTNAGLGF